MKHQLCALLISFFGFAAPAFAHALDDHQHYHCHKSMDCHTHAHHNDHH